MTKEEAYNLFLSLKDFDDYMDHYDKLIGIPSDSHIFRKEMELMETDEKYTHRKKENIREKRKREMITQLQQEIEDLRDETLIDGNWLPVDTDEQDVVITYQYPNGKNGDIDHAVACTLGKPVQLNETTYMVIIPAEKYRKTELLSFLKRSISSGYDYFNLETDPSAIFLNKYNRIFQIEKRMWKINLLKPKSYRNIRSIEDTKLRKLLQEYHQSISRKRNKVYEKQIVKGSTNARWISEQTAFAIVKEKYPDAIFQYESEWLHGQRLDIYIPSHNTAIEYQGQQHTSAIDFFGGKEGLADNQYRDHKKKYLCERNNVHLIYWNYDEPLTKEYFEQNIENNIKGVHFAYTDS